MSLNSSKALFVDQDANFSVRDDIYHEHNDPNELFIETLYSGVNPADSKHATLLGIRSTVIGYDFCGRILSAPSGSNFSNGDIVAGYTPSRIGRPTKYGTHQPQLLCPEDLVFRVPSNLSESHAAALTVVAMTAADAVFNIFKLPLPTTPAVFSSPILIWGASSSVGICAVQFLRASGCQNIFVTASPARHALLRSLGATHVFDYSSSTVVGDIAAAVEALGQGPITNALDAVGTFTTPSSADMVAQSVKNSAAILASVVKFDEGFQMPLALIKDGFHVHPLGAPHPISIPAQPERHWRAWEGFQWAVKNYGTKFKLPSVEVFDGTAEDALQEIIKVGGEGRGFGKLVIRQPFR
ncbi:NAD(P)-binding protein [Clathrospora elynae]|uniref:NAD(P)-binding protein n=1 Tax=Clathrospora elynae TaxID=706981 RepID=A0A6A5SHG4_9PLEO|nr:NAD(P)-binding protein [Clathrospora elynae]